MLNLCSLLVLWLPPRSIIWILRFRAVLAVSIIIVRHSVGFSLLGHGFSFESRCELSLLQLLSYTFVLREVPFVRRYFLLQR